MEADAPLHNGVWIDHEACATKRSRVRFATGCVFVSLLAEIQPSSSNSDRAKRGLCLVSRLLEHANHICSQPPKL
eukprot:9952167-Heterocapsa_arctica.AAC.1